jgi:7-keto-8-aminopelargonate synthetase-like enzyme
LSKAYHITGGGVSCSNGIASKLKSSPFYTGSTPISPAFIHAFLNGQLLYHKQQKRLQDNITRFISFIKDIPGICYHPELPIFILPEIDADTFAKYKIIISSFAYPDALGKRITRVVLNALHTEEDLQKISNILHSFVLV